MGKRDVPYSGSIFACQSRYLMRTCARRGQRMLVLGDSPRQLQRLSETCPERPGQHSMVSDKRCSLRKYKALTVQNERIFVPLGL